MKYDDFDDAFDGALKKALTEHAYEELAAFEAPAAHDGYDEPVASGVLPASKRCEEPAVSGTLPASGEREGSPMNKMSKRAWRSAGGAARHGKLLFKVAAVLAACVCFFVGANANVSSATNEFMNSLIAADENEEEASGIYQPPLDGYRLVEDIGAKLDLPLKDGTENILLDYAYSVKDTNGKIVKTSFGNGIGAVITKKFRKDDNAHIGLYLNLTPDHSNKRGENMIIGYYKDGVFTRVFFGKVVGVELNIAMPETGEYMFCVMNASAGMVNMDEFSVSKGADS
jgi:hypothetical protein